MCSVEWAAVFRPVRRFRKFYLQKQELNDLGSNELLLRKISEFTGGHFNPEPKAVFDPARRSVPSTLRLWPGLLALAIALNVAELFVRKWRGLFAGGESVRV